MHGEGKVLKGVIVVVLHRGHTQDGVDFTLYQLPWLTVPFFQGLQSCSVWLGFMDESFG